MSVELTIEQTNPITLTIEEAIAPGLSIEEGPSTITTIEVDREVEVTIQTAGIQGPPGADGSGTQYTHTQAVAATVWTVNHNFGRLPSAVRVLTVGGKEITADVDDVSVNQLTITFSSAQAGSAVLS